MKRMFLALVLTLFGGFGAICHYSYLLSVEIRGTGSGRVVDEWILTNPDEGDCHIDCGEECSCWIPPHRATLVALPDEGSMLQGWAGCSSVKGSRCEVDLSKDRHIIVRFDLASP